MSDALNEFFTAVLRALFPRWVPESYHFRGTKVTKDEYYDLEALYDLWQEPFEGVIVYPTYRTRWWDKWFDKIDPTSH